MLQSKAIRLQVKPTRKDKLKKLVEGSFHNKSMFEHYQYLWAKEVGMTITVSEGINGHSEKR